VNEWHPTVKNLVVRDRLAAIVHSRPSTVTLAWEEQPQFHGVR
jgi:hypothetical protein